MDDQYRSAVFLGYDSESPAYMVGYATKNGAMAVAVCSDVKFDENRTVSDLKQVGVTTGSQKMQTGMVDRRRGSGAAAVRTGAGASEGKKRHQKRKLSTHEQTEDDESDAAQEIEKMLREVERVRKRAKYEDDDVVMCEAQAAAIGPKGALDEDRAKWVEADEKERNAITVWC